MSMRVAGSTWPSLRNSRRHCLSCSIGSCGWQWVRIVNTAANSLLIPLQCEFYALEGLSQLVQTFQRIKGGLNPGLKIAGILLTMFDRRTNLSHQVAEDAENHFKDLVFKTTIPRNVRLGEAPSFGQPILLYDAMSPGAASYFSLAKEIMAANRVGHA